MSTTETQDLKALVKPGVIIVADDDGELIRGPVKSVTPEGLFMLDEEDGEVASVWWNHVMLPVVQSTDKPDESDDLVALALNDIAELAPKARALIDFGQVEGCIEPDTLRTMLSEAMTTLENKLDLLELAALVCSVAKHIAGVNTHETILNLKSRGQYGNKQAEAEADELIPA